jgi:hypothetical protein
MHAGRTRLSARCSGCSLACLRQDCRSQQGVYCCKADTAAATVAEAGVAAVARAEGLTCSCWLATWHQHAWHSAVCFAQVAKEGSHAMQHGWRHSVDRRQCCCNKYSGVRAVADLPCTDDSTDPRRDAQDSSDGSSSSRPRRRAGGSASQQTTSWQQQQQQQQQAGVGGDDGAVLQGLVPQAAAMRRPSDQDVDADMADMADRDV